jgi:hypothetical protein
MLADLKMYARFAWGLRGFLREAITLEEAEAIVRKRLAEREDNFLRLVEKGIFGYARSPYLPLLKLAQVELGDIQDMVRRKGLEDTLRALREAGVYVTFEEYKGREPMVRDGAVIPVGAHDFDNPYLRRYYYRESGGTTGAATRAPTDLDHLAAQAPALMLFQHAHGLLDVPNAMWLGVLPDGSGLNWTLRQALLGQVVEKWFSPKVIQDLRLPLKFRIANQFIVRMGQLFGAPLPRPQPLSLDEAVVVARWMARTLETHSACHVSTQVSQALRVCIAAQEEGLDLRGAVFLVGGEPPTPAKVRMVTQIGARWIPGYWLADAGCVGQGCCQPVDCNDIHLFKDAFALTQCRRRVPGSEMSVDAFHLTTLLPTSPKLLLNVETDDYGLIERRACGCPLESYGFTEHVRHIRSFSKLTGEGVTLVGSEMIRILEEVLPARFGGSPLDYQLLEEEDGQGFTRLSLLVSPKVEIADETEVSEAVLEALSQSSIAADLARAIWGQAGTLRIRRMEPILTARGKLMPLHLAHGSDCSADTSMGSASVPRSSSRP